MFFYSTPVRSFQMELTRLLPLQSPFFLLYACYVILLFLMVWSICIGYQMFDHSHHLWIFRNYISSYLWCALLNLFLIKFFGNGIHCSFFSFNFRLITVDSLHTNSLQCILLLVVFLPHTAKQL